MKYFGVSLVAVLILGCSEGKKRPQGEAAKPPDIELSEVPPVRDTPENRAIHAKRYLKVASMRDMMMDAATEMAKNFPEDERDDFLRTMTEEVQIEVLEELCLAAMQKHFTAAELNALADFYGSPEGKTVLKKFGKYMAEIMPPLQAELRRAVVAIQRRK